MTLDFGRLRDAAKPVQRIIFAGAPLGWAAMGLAAHYIGGLAPLPAAVLGGILVVTGPTVVLPMLRQARIAPKPASVLRWEAIVNDAVGALFAVVAFEIAVDIGHGGNPVSALPRFALEIAGAGAVGFAVGKGAAFAFRSGAVAEYLKAPGLFALVLGCYAAGNQLLDEAGLLAVTVMGIVLGNARLASLDELRRFKEYVAVLLVSGLFIVLTANTDLAIIFDLDWRAYAFVGLLIFAIRPTVVALSMLGANLTWRETLLTGWIAPRGVVAVAVAGVFGEALAAAGHPDGVKLTALVFVIVVATVLLHGLTVKPLAALLGLASEKQAGVLIVGGNGWTVALAKALKALDVPVMIADTAWRRLWAARLADIPVFYGEILSEVTDHTLDTNRFGHLIAATDNDAYNALVCTDFAPEFGRQQVFQAGRPGEDQDDPHALSFTLGGRTLFKSGIGYDELQKRIAQGWEFRRTKLTEEFGFDDYLAQRPEGAEVLLAVRADGRIQFAAAGKAPKAGPGDTLLSFAPKEPARGAMPSV